MLKSWHRCPYPFLLFLLLTACHSNEVTPWQGYAEGEYLYIAAQRSGRLQELSARRGERVAAGTPLFRLEPEPEASAAAEARQRLEQAGFRRDDLEQGARPSELAILEAQLMQAQVARDLAETEFVRQESLFAENVTPRELLDRSRATLDQASAAVTELQARLTSARLGGRNGLRHALNAEAKALKESLRLAEWNLAQKNLSAPTSGLVFDTLFEIGEVVPAGAPAIILLPETGRKARFFVPEAALSTLHLGNRVLLCFDGGEIQATITFISPQAEYTPPVIYSRDSRSKLVYLVEARPDQASAARLKPGQPLEVKAL